MRRKLMFIAPFAIVGCALFIALGGAVVQALWNWLTPGLFGWREITFWQALGLLALSRILFGGFRLNAGGPQSRIHERFADRFAERVGQRWDQMSPEERERLRQRVRERCGFDPSASEKGT